MFFEGQQSGLDEQQHNAYSHQERMTKWQLDVNLRLYSKYSQSQNYYYTRDVNEILANARTDTVVKHSDIVTLDESVEYLKRSYALHEYPSKSQLLTEYYKYHKDIPRLFMLPATIELNAYYDTKRKLDYFKIAGLIEEENKLNPEKPPKGIVGDKPALEAEEDDENDQNRNDHSESDGYLSMNGVNLLDDLSSFINHGQTELSAVQEMQTEIKVMQRNRVDGQTRQNKARLRDDGVVRVESRQMQMKLYQQQQTTALTATSNHGNAAAGTIVTVTAGNGGGESSSTKQCESVVKLPSSNFDQTHLDHFLQFLRGSQGADEGDEKQEGIRQQQIEHQQKQMLSSQQQQQHIIINDEPQGPVKQSFKVMTSRANNNNNNNNQGDNIEVLDKQKQTIKIHDEVDSVGVESEDNQFHQQIPQQLLVGQMPSMNQKRMTPNQLLYHLQQQRHHHVQQSHQELPNKINKQQQTNHQVVILEKQCKKKSSTAIKTLNVATAGMSNPTPSTSSGAATSQFIQNYLSQNNASHKMKENSSSVNNTPRQSAGTTNALRTVSTLSTIDPFQSLNSATSPRDKKKTSASSISRIPMPKNSSTSATQQQLNQIKPSYPLANMRSFVQQNEQQQQQQHQLHTSQTQKAKSAQIVGPHDIKQGSSSSPYHLKLRLNVSKASSKSQSSISNINMRDTLSHRSGSSKTNNQNTLDLATPKYSFYEILKQSAGTHQDNLHKTASKSAYSQVFQAPTTDQPSTSIPSTKSTSIFFKQKQTSPSRNDFPKKPSIQKRYQKTSQSPKTSPPPPPSNQTKATKTNSSNLLRLIENQQQQCQTIEGNQIHFDAMALETKSERQPLLCWLKESQQKQQKSSQVQPTNIKTSHDSIRNTPKKPHSVQLATKTSPTQFTTHSIASSLSSLQHQHTQQQYTTYVVPAQIQQLQHKHAKSESSLVIQQPDQCQLERNLANLFNIKQPSTRNQANTSMKSFQNMKSSIGYSSGQTTQVLASPRSSMQGSQIVANALAVSERGQTRSSLYKSNQQPFLSQRKESATGFSVESQVNSGNNSNSYFGCDQAFTNWLSTQIYAPNITNGGISTPSSATSNQFGLKEHKTKVNNKQNQQSLNSEFFTQNNSSQHSMASYPTLTAIRSALDSQHVSRPSSSTANKIKKKSIF